MSDSYFSREFRRFVSILFLLTGASLTAAPIPVSISGIFANPYPLPPDAFHEFPTATPPGSVFDWGTSTFPAEFTYEAPTSISASGSGYDVGKFTYYNGNVDAGTAVTSVDLVLTITFDSIPSQILTFNLAIINSPNVGDADIDRDTVTILNSPVLIPGTGFQLALGFLTDPTEVDFFGNIVGTTVDGSQVSVLEDWTAQARLIATISEAQGVPDGGATSLLLGSTFALMSFLRRFRR